MYRRDADAVYRYALALGGNPAWAADATQDAFVAFAQQPQAFDASRGPLGAYLAGMARHRLLRRWREAPVTDRTDEMDEQACAGVPVTPESLLVERQDLDALWAALRRLPWPQREALPPPPTAPVPPAVTWTARALAPRGTGVTTALGSREIEGLRAHGERTSWTIEAGKVGNEKPIVIVREVWTSPELLLTVQSRDFDPRRGEENYRLTRLRRGEPDAALMKVPADYSRGPAGAGRG